MEELLDLLGLWTNERVVKEIAKKDRVIANLEEQLRLLGEIEKGRKQVCDHLEKELDSLNSFREHADSLIKTMASEIDVLKKMLEIKQFTDALEHKND